MVTTVSDDYAAIAPWYDRFLEPIDRPLRAKALELCPAVPGQTVLDVGCGTGSHLAEYVDRGAVGTGLDRSPAMLETARRRLAGRASLVLGDATSLPFDSDGFDMVVASLFLHELTPEVRSASLEEMVRVVRPTGTVVVIDYRNGPMRWRGHAWRALSTGIERIAGSDHYRQYRAYLTSGGLPPALPAGLEVSVEKPVSGGNLAIWLLTRTDERTTGND